MSSNNPTAALLEAINELNKVIESLNKQLQQKEEEAARIQKERDLEIKLLREQIEYFKKQKFGPKSEKTSVITGQLVMPEVLERGQFDEAEESAEEDVLTEITTKKKTRKGYSREKVLASLPIEERIYGLSEEDKVCSVDGSKLSYVGKKYLRAEIEYIPATVKVIHVYKENWECRTCRAAERSYIQEASVPQPLLQHSMASPSSVAWTMYQKYVNHLPLYRQSKDWSNLGLEISRGTLSSWIIKTADEYLKPVVDQLRTHLLKENCLHVDETPVQVLKEPGRNNRTKSYMWVYSTIAESKAPIRIYDYCPGRSAEFVVEFLKDYSGFLHVDAYSAYGKVKNATLCYCWAHARRKYAEAMPKDLKSKEATLVKQGLEFCNKLFKFEDKLKSLAPEERKEQRLLLEKPVLEAYWSWVETSIVTVPPKQKIGQALQYSLNQKTGLMNYLMDGHCQISNNTAENSIRPFTVGRKNWLFSGSPKGAASSAAVYSIVETAKANGLNPHKYLQKLLEELPQMKESGTTDLELVMPWNDKIRKTCS